MGDNEKAGSMMEQHSDAWYDGCHAAVEGNLNPNFTGMTEEEIDSFNDGYLYMTQNSMVPYPA